MEFYSLLLSHSTKEPNFMYKSIGASFMWIARKMAKLFACLGSSTQLRHTIERRMDLWSDNNIDLLIQEAVRYDRTFNRPLQSMNKEHTNKIFTLLMLQRKIRPAMHWLTSTAKGHVLLPENIITVDVDGVAQSMSIVDPLKLRHPTSHPPHSSTLLNRSQLQLLEDVEVRAAHIGPVARRIQGSAGPGGCDSTHWHDMFLRFGSCRQRLRDSIADLTHHLTNTKSPAVHPISIEKP